MKIHSSPRTANLRVHSNYILRTTNLKEYLTNVNFLCLLNLNALTVAFSPWIHQIYIKIIYNLSVPFAD